MSANYPGELWTGAEETMPERAIGFVETRGYTGLAQATDAMVKSGRVDFFREEHIGGGFVSTMVCGEVAAVRSAVTAGAAVAGEFSTLVATNTIPSLHSNVWTILEGGKGDWGAIATGHAFGVIEAHGFTAMVEAADAACKAGEVAFVGYVLPGGGFAAAVFRGEVAAVRSATDAGTEAGRRVGKVVGVHVIPSPHLRIQAVFPMGAEISPEEVPPIPGRALGVVETRGFTGIVEALDRAVKAATVEAVGWQKVGSALLSVNFRGDVGAVRSSLAAAEEGAKAVGELVSTLFIPGPDRAVDEIIPPPRKKK